MMTLEEKKLLLSRLIREKAEKTKKPLSFAQLRLWFLDQLHAGSPEYNIVYAAEISGPLDILILEQSLNEVIRRHESLRTNIIERDGIPVQKIHGSVSLKLQYTDLIHEEKKTEKTQEIFRNESQRLFSLSEDLLVRAHLVRLDKERHALLLIVHHIVSDGWSMEVFVRECLEGYEAFCNHRSPELPILPFQYADFACWQHSFSKTQEMRKQTDYWKHKLSGISSDLDLPTDYPRPSMPSYEGESAPFIVSHELTEGLKKLSRETEGTLFMILLAAFNLLLHRYSGKEDIVVGTPIANRHRKDTETLIGLFINTLALRTDLSSDLTFWQLIEQVRETSLGAYAHQDLPFEKLVEESSPERNLNRSPLFQVMFVLQNMPQASLKISGLTLNPIRFEAGLAQQDLSLRMEEEQGEIHGEFEFKTSLFHKLTIERMIRHFFNLLVQVVQNPERRLSQFTLLSEIETQEILKGWNDTARNYPRSLCLQELFEQQVQKTPQAMALVGPHGETLTYNDLNKRANQLAHHLRSLGVGPETCIGVRLERSIEMVIFLLGILKAGAAYLPIDPAYPQERLNAIIEGSGLKIILDEKFDWGMTHSCSMDDPNLITTPKNIAYVIYTSGSTGTPKGVMNTHEGICNRLLWMQEAYGLTKDDRVLQKTPFTFDVSVWEFFWPLMTGSTLVLAKPEGHKDPDYLTDLIRKEKITTLHFVPSMLQAFLQAEGLKSLTSLKRVICSGEELPWVLRNRFYERLNAKLHNLYGPTEAAVDVTFWACKPEDEETRVPIGKPIANTQIYLVDKYFNPVPVGIAGELMIGGVGLARGYLNRPDLTAEKFIPDPFSDKPGARLYRTGDLAKYLQDGNIEFLGRIDHQVKIRGFRIELAEIESVLLRDAFLREAVVVAHGEGLEKKLVAYVILQENRKRTSDELKKHLKERLPEYMVPSFFIFLKELPLTSSGKINRRALPKPEGTRPEDMRGYVAPRDEVEEKLAVIWKEVLGIEKVGVFDNFFELGGHSLLAIQIISRLRNLGYHPPLRTVFKNPTIAGLAQILEQEKGRKAIFEYPPLIPVPRDQKLPLSFAQERLWFLDQMEPGNPFYNIPVALRLRGSLHVQALEQALNEIVVRHEALRTVFETIEGEPVQTIQSFSPSSFVVMDLRDIPAAKREFHLRSLMEEEAQKPFELARGPLFRTQLIQDEDHAFVLLITTHHIVFDGSQNVFAKEFVEFYEAFAAGRLPKVSPLPVQYADFAQWQRKFLEPLLQNQLLYWKQKLGEDPPVLQLPTDRPRPSVQSFRGSTRNFKLNDSLAERLKSFSRKEGTSLFATLLSAFFVLLYRYTEQEDITVGSPYLDRPQVETEKLIGCFVNTLIYRTQPTAGQSFREFLAQVRQVVLEAQENKDIPFERLAHEIRHKRNLSHSPLFQVMFSFNAAAREKDLALSGIDVSFLDVNTQSSRFDWLLALTEDVDGLVGSIEYSTDLFDDATIERMLVHFENILEGIAKNPNEKIAALPLLTDSEKSQIVDEWNKTDGEYPRDILIHELFEAQVQKTPQALAVVGFIDDHPCEWTYEELNIRSNQLAHDLISLGTGRGSLVGVYMSRSPHMISTLLGILKTGAAYVPLDVSHPLKRIQQILDSLKIITVLTEREHQPILEEWQQSLSNLKNIVCVDDQKKQSMENLSRQGSATDLAYIIFTSGSTGTPKEVMVRHRPVLNLIDWIQKTFPVDASDRLLFVTSLCFDLSVYDIFGILAAGGSIRVASHEELRDPERLLNILSREPITFWDSAPAAMKQLVPFFSKLDSDQSYPLKRVFMSGDWIPVTLPDQIRSVFRRAQIISLGGATEATVWSNYFPIEKVNSDWISIPYGKPIQNAQYYILDSFLNPCPVGIPGDLYIGGECLSSGYVNDPDLTSQKFIPDPFSQAPGSLLYKTGDRARYWIDGNMEFLGRKDHQVKIRGFRIELGEIETALAGHPSIRESAVCVLEDRSEKYLAAFIVPHEGQASTSGDIKGFLKQLLPEPMIPSSFVFLEKLPLSANGKVNRKALMALEGEKFERTTTYVAPRNEVEEKLAAIWQEVLGIEKIGVHDDFFELGGHSLLATQAVSRIREELQTNLPLRSLFEFPTVAGLGDAFAKDIKSDRAQLPPLLPTSRKEQSAPLSFAQQRLWYVDRLNSKNPAHNINFAVRLRGRVNVTALQQAINEIVKRHQILRAKFFQVDEQTAKMSFPNDLESELIYADLRQLPTSRKEIENSKYLVAKGQQPFNLEKDLLFRVHLLRLGEDDHALLFTAHHIVFDGWSMSVLVKELSALYKSLLVGKPSPLPELPIQYADFAHWQHTTFQGETLKTYLDYWINQLSNNPPPLCLPADKARFDAQPFRGAQQPFLLPADLTTELNALSHQKKVTLFMTLLAAFKTFLYRYSGQVDIIVGFPNANRTHWKIKDLIGYFSDTQLLRTDLSGNPSFSDLLSRVRKVVLGAYNYQELPIQKIMQALQPGTGLDYKPIYEVRFSLQNYSIPTLDLPGLAITSIEEVDGHGGSTRDLSLYMEETTKGLSGCLEYNSELFNDSTISQMIKSFETLLIGIVTDPGQLLSLLPLI